MISHSLLRHLCRKTAGFTSVINPRNPEKILVHCKSTMAASFYDPDILKFLDDSFKLIKEEALQKGTDGSVPVVEFKQPHELQQLLELDISSQPASHDALLDGMKKIIRYSVKTGHPHFYNQLYAGIDPYSQVGSWLTESLNSNIHTYEVSPVFIVMEKFLFKRICDIIGYSDGDGIFCPGGSASNVMALHCARYNKFPQVKEQGVFNLPPIRCYVSEDGHYSLKKAVSYLGMGSDNMVPIKTDARGKVIIEDFRSKIEADKKQGFAPTFMMATCGSTVLGSFDNLRELNSVCREHGIWLHADACWGGGVLMSKKHRYLMDGVELCDSVAWNFHKMFSTPLQTSALLLKDKDILMKTNSSNAEYLFQPDKYYDSSFDVGDKTIQCGRRVDAVKLYMQWRAFGDSGFESRVDQAYDNVRYLQEKMRTTDGFRLVLPEFESTNTCFWYIPPRLRGQAETKEWWDQVGKVAPKVKERLVKSGSMMINCQPMTSKGFVNFFRPIVHNPNNDFSHMDKIIAEIQRCGEDL